MYMASIDYDMIDSTNSVVTLFRDEISNSESNIGYILCNCELE